MERWSGRVAVVTGASSGIGAATVRVLVNYGLKVVGIARRVEKVEEISLELSGAKGKLYPRKADVSKEEDILSVFKWIKEHLGGVDILINNAGIASQIMLTDGDASQFKQLFDVNVIGLSICTKEALKSMKDRGVDDGHIVHVSSTAGHYIADLPGIFPYTATKHAVRVLTEGLRRELVQQKRKIRVTSISPGPVDTEMLQSVKDHFPKNFELPMLQAKDVADAIVYALSAPPHVQVHEVMIRPVGKSLADFAKESLNAQTD